MGRLINDRSVYLADDGKHYMLGSAGSFISSCTACGGEVFRVREPSTEQCLYCRQQAMEPVLLEDLALKWVPAWQRAGIKLHYARINRTIARAHAVLPQIQADKLPFRAYSLSKPGGWLGFETEEQAHEHAVHMNEIRSTWPHRWSIEAWPTQPEPWVVVQNLFTEVRLQ